MYKAPSPYADADHFPLARLHGKYEDAPTYAQSGAKVHCFPQWSYFHVQQLDKITHLSQL